MKKLVALAVLLLFGFVLAAETPAGWIDDFAEAQKIAQKENRPMLLLFTGSDWCPYCIQLHDEILSKSAFKNFAASKNLVLVYIDFPRQSKMSREAKRRNEQLARQYGIEGFPTTIVLSADGKELGRTPEGYLDALNRMLKK